MVFSALFHPKYKLTIADAQRSGSIFNDEHN
jgi:hypothetical protein